MTLHRRENINDLKRLKRIFVSIGNSKAPTLLPLHPHTQKVIKNTQITLPSNIQIISPLAYHKFLNLVAFSSIVITSKLAIKYKPMKKNILIGLLIVLALVGYMKKDFLIEKGSDLIFGGQQYNEDVLMIVLNEPATDISPYSLNLNNMIRTANVFQGLVL